MPQQQSPWLEAKYGWNFGESNWNTGVDENLLKFSFLFDRNVDGVVSTLPAAVNGKAYFLTTDKRLYFTVNTTYFSCPTPKWFEFVVRGTGITYQFDGTNAVQVDSASGVDSRLDAVELSVASLGTASTKNTEFFATTARVDVVEANAQSTADSAVQVIGEYAAGLVLRNRNQGFRYLEDIYLPTASTVLPYTTTGAGAGEIATFRNIGDVLLRSDLGLTTGASHVTHKAQTVAQRLDEEISLKDYYVVGDGSTNNLTQIQAAISAANGKIIRVSAGALGGEYAITSGTLVIPDGTRFLYDGNARIYAAGGTIANSGKHISILGPGLRGPVASATKGIAIELSGNSGTYTDSTLAINKIVITDDTMDAAPNNNGTKVDGFQVFHTFGGAAAKGGRHAADFVLHHNAITADDNPDRNYVGVAGSCWTSVGDGGTFGIGRGGYFGGNFVATNYGGSYITGLVACEFNTNTMDVGGNGAALHYGISIVAGHKERGYVKDSAINISSKSSSTVTWRDGITFGNANGAHPLGSDSRVLLVEDNGGIRMGFEIPACSQSVLKSGNLDITNSGFTNTSTNARLELGSTTSTGNPLIDFHSSGNNNDFDARISSGGGSATAGSGSLTVSAVEFVVGCTLRPGTDNLNSLGRADRRWSVVYAATGAINTSDENSKQQIKPIDAAALRAWGKVEYQQYKFNDSVEEKGKAARWHFGVIAQRVVEAFESEGLSAFDYGLLCYDEWPEVQEVLSDDGEVITAYQEAGSRYGIRYEEALALECAYLRSMIAK